ncbi:hypothetical protein HY439_03545, partial [Candidatus Microgenomates bacterium]|nr:hypothetical protein [Candidatus Microgenomates bacterium]
MGSALKLFKILIHVALAFLGIVIVFLTVYLLGWELLETPFKGNELTFVTTMADWVDRWLFQGVQWYPAHGGGVSVTQSTQIEVYYVISFLHRFTGLSLIQTTKLLSFLLIFLVSLEIYFLVWWRFKSQTMAFLAAFFFPLSQAAWIEITYLGVLALPFSVLFILPAFFLFDLYLRERKAKIFVLVVFTFGLIFLAHIIIAELVTGILLVWALLFPYVFSAKNKWESLKFGLLAWFKTVFLGSLLISFWFLPFLHYVGIVGRNLISFKTLGQVNYVTLPFLLGFGDAWGGKSELALFFALPVLIFAFLGFLVAIFKKDKLVILLSFLAILFLIYPSLPYFVPQFVQVFFMNIVEQSYERAFAIPLVILPILASYGLFQGSKLILFPLKGSIGVVLVSFLAIFLAGLGIVVFRHVPPPPPEAVPCYFGYGPWFYSETVNDYCRFWDKLKNFRLSLGEERLPFDEKMQAILEKTGIDSQSRLDISPLHGSLVMALPLYSQASTVNIQLNIASLNKILWGYQVGSFYVRHDFGGPREVASLASWFGIEHLVLSSADPLEKYTADYWKEVVDEKGLIIKKFKGPAGMVTLSSQPKILVLGKFKNRAYEQFFRLANAGAYPYGKAMFVEGKDSGQIDD